jgi:hypothetical protein
MDMHVAMVADDDFGIVVYHNDGFALRESENGRFVDTRDTKNPSVRDAILTVLDDAAHRWGESFRKVYPVETLLRFVEQFEQKVFSELSGPAGEDQDDDADVRSQTAAKPDSNLMALHAELLASQAAVNEMVAKRQRRGVVLYDDLWHVFADGTRVLFSTRVGQAAGIVRSVSYRQSFMSNFAVVEIEVIHLVTGQSALGLIEKVIPYFAGVARLQSLPVRIVSTQDPDSLVQMGELSARGEAVMNYYKPRTYCSYEGNMFVHNDWHETTLYATGRVMVDPETIERICPGAVEAAARSISMRLHTGDYYDDDSNDKGKSDELPVTVDDWWRVIPLVVGFSIMTKAWGQFKASGLSDVTWSENAYDMLVLDSRKKRMIRALVEHNGSGFSDVIQGKGGGSVFLLHGAPGEGKTMTAEAVAELLRRPLYAASVGELGTNPVSLERALKQILDIATAWNAVILIDEIDIFIEARNTSDILRNAMVGVCLRLLEYHQGVIFLTTNRVRNLDKAFLSRISVGIRFPASTREKRKQVWTNLLGASGLSPGMAGRLARYDINGRQIKNAIRLAQTIAKSENRAVAVHDLVEVVEQTDEFRTSLTLGGRLFARTRSLLANLVR